MAKKPATPKRGRPPKKAGEKLSVHAIVRITKAMSDALDVYREDNSLNDRSDAIRHIVREGLKAKGLLE